MYNINNNCNCQIKIIMCNQVMHSQNRIMLKKQCIISYTINNNCVRNNASSYKNFRVLVLKYTLHQIFYHRSLQNVFIS
ncbi:hypothetical protein BpHYR1_043236 [Brachionus plicatilis]|uniref:Uncharacterized protein n=1 Tax=Brachionus plicatilis TaxID=10195 RepID=A0A3M7QDA6_BRAPC|nr:hypothetical protein BpHYR1_043236 [Brachionus plicatilis]